VRTKHKIRRELFFLKVMYGDVGRMIKPCGGTGRKIGHELLVPQRTISKIELYSDEMHFGQMLCYVYPGIT